MSYSTILFISLTTCIYLSIPLLIVATQLTILEFRHPNSKRITLLLDKFVFLIIPTAFCWLIYFYILAQHNALT